MIEAEDRKNPEGATVVKLAATLGVSIDWLLTGSGPKPTAETIRKHATDEVTDNAPPDSERRTTTPPADEGAA